MKTSNKLILGFILAVFGVSLAIHGVLYREYRKGHFISAMQLHAEEFVRQPAFAPRVISIDGAIWVNLIPADSFALELPRINKDPDAGLFQPVQNITRLKGAPEPDRAITFHQTGDTLFVTGNVHIPIHRPWSNYYYRRSLPEVNIFGSSFENILLNNGQFYLQGGADPGAKQSARIMIRNSTLWIGMQYDSHQAAPPEFFDSLDIHSANSIILVNTAAKIDHLHTILTDSSTINDQYSTIKSSAIESSANSRVEFSGDNLKKNQLIIH